MPLLDVQQQHDVVFRLRFGETVPTSSGKGTKPQRLTDQIRVTARSADIVAAFTRVYGGDVRPWDNQGRAEFEAYLPTREIKIALLPGHSITQHWEKYRGAVCERRCDGVTESKSRKACMCPSPPDERNRDPRQCSATTRVSLACPDVQVAGTGMFTSHGMMAARLLPTSVEIARVALNVGEYVDPRLRIVEYVGDGTRWVVPQIEVVGQSFHELIAAAEERRALNGGVLDGSASPRILGWTPPPPPELEAGDVGSVREQMVQGPAEPSTRKNAQTPIPPTGVEPRPVADLGDEEPVDAEIVPPADAEADAETHRKRSQRVAIEARNAGLDDDGRHALVHWSTNGRTSSSKVLSANEAERAIDTARRIAAGELRITDEGSVVDTTFAFAQPATPIDHTYTVEQVQKMTGREICDVLRSLDPPISCAGKVDEIRERLMQALGLGEEPF